MGKSTSDAANARVRQCPTCGAEDLWRIRRSRAWMRLLPRTTLHGCFTCHARYIHLFNWRLVQCKAPLSPVSSPTGIDKPTAGSAPNATGPVASTAQQQPCIEPQPSQRPQRAAEAFLPARAATPHPSDSADGGAHGSAPEIAATPRTVVGRKEVEDFFGLSAFPFTITPDPRFMYLSANHQQVLSEMLCAIRDRQGYVVITGHIGCGKTTLCRLLLERLGDSASTALIINPGLSEMELLASIIEDFGIEVENPTKKAYLDGLNDFLLAQKEQDTTSVLIVDEAQSTTPEVLEGLRMLSNFETNDSKLLQTILVGQPELRDLLVQPALTQFRQRVNTWCHLPPLTREEVGHYVEHRLSVAGGGCRPTFSPEALDLVFRYSAGTPRLINVLCDRILRLACVNRTTRISLEIVTLAQERVGAPA